MPTATTERPAWWGWVRKTARALAHHATTKREGLYLGRMLVNVGEWEAWALRAGLRVLDGDLHVTIVYSKKGVNLPAAQPKVTVPATAITKLGYLGKDSALVVHFTSPELEARHKEALAAGAVSDYESFQPHLTLYYDAAQSVDPASLPLPDIPIVLGPEYAGPVKEDVFQKAAADDPVHPGWPAGSPGGRGGEYMPRRRLVGRRLRPGLLRAALARALRAEPPPPPELMSAAEFLKLPRQAGDNRHAFLKALASGTQEKPSPSYLTRLGERLFVRIRSSHGRAGAFGLSVDPKRPNVVELSELRALTAGGGHTALSFLIKKADRYGITLTGYASPIGGRAGKSEKGGTLKVPSREQLLRFYKRYGFSVLPSGEEGRLPQPTTKETGWYRIVRRPREARSHVAKALRGGKRAWNEADHPRVKDGPGGDKDGRFTSKLGSPGGRGTPKNRRSLRGNRWTRSNFEGKVAVSITPSRERAFAERSTGRGISKQVAGDIGEAIVGAWLRVNGGRDARPANARHPSFPVDLRYDHAIVESKTGQTANQRDAWKWRLTFNTSEREKALLAKMSPAARTAYNAAKLKATYGRKMKVARAVSARTGKRAKTVTMTVIINPSTQRADLYKFDGFHPSIRWVSEQARRGYVGSVRYTVRRSG